MANDLIGDDPIMKRLWEGEEAWGNIVPVESHRPNDYSIKHNQPAIPTWVPSDPYFQARIAALLAIDDEEEYLEGWNVPDLALRKGIWENFPVILDAIRSTNGTDRYAIMWHRKHFEEWRNNPEKTLKQAEYVDYPFYQEYRLLYAIAHHPGKYVLEPPRAKNQIAVLAMVHRVENGTRKHNAARNNTIRNARKNANKNTRKNARNAPIPVLKRLNDIKAHFPVVWHEVPGKAGTKTYALELYGKQVQELSRTAGYNVRVELTDRLLAALRKSRSWRVLDAAAPREVARLEMVVAA